MNYTELTYVEEGLNRFLGTYNVTNLLGDIEVLPICSDPTSIDGDGDGIIDKFDPHKLSAVDNNTACLYRNFDSAYDETNPDNHYYQKIDVSENNLLVLYRCENCKRELTTSIYYESHNYICYPSEDSKNTIKSLENNEYEFVGADIQNQLGYIKYNNQKYAVTYLDVTNNQSWFVDNYKCIVDYTDTTRRFDFAAALSGSINTTNIPKEDFIWYDASGNVIQNFKNGKTNSKVLDRNYHKVNAVYAVTVFLDFIQSGYYLENVHILLLQNEDGKSIAHILFYIAYPPKAEQGITYSPVWKLGINSQGELFFLSDWGITRGIP